MSDLLVHKIFESQVKEDENALAVIEEGVATSYGSLNSYSNKLGCLLHDLGLSKGDRVAMMIEPSIGMVAALLSIFKHGGIYVPLSKQFSSSWFSLIINECNPRILFVSSADSKGVQQLLSSLNLSINYIIEVGKGEDVSVLENQSGHYVTKDMNFVYSGQNPSMTLEPEDANYIFYTSGSTGQPKGILGSHKGLTHFINWEIKEFSLDNNCRVSQLSQFTFDASLRDIFVPLCAGGCLCIPDSSTREHLPHLLSWIAKQEVNLLHGVPSLLRVLIKEHRMGNIKYSFPSLKYVLMAGELLYNKDITSFRQELGEHIEFVNLYGATETTLVKTFHRVKTLVGDGSHVLPVGKGISDTAIAIINENRLCKVGEIGEVYIKTNYWTKGYYNNDALSETVFVQNPLVSDREDKVYKTGDLGRYTRDFDVEVLGRLDSQVKVNGVRIELNAIEAALRKTSGIEEVVVTVYKDKEEETHLVCYYTGELLSAESLRLMLSVELNNNSMPGYFVYLEEFPYNLNGKINKKALPSPRTVTDNESYQEPTNAIELKLVAIWKEVLLLDKVSTKISFFEIGGSSLRAIQMISRIYKSFEVLLTVANVFDFPTISGLSTVINDSLEKKYEQIPVAAHADYYDLSHAQKRLWILDQLEGGSNGYNIGEVFVFKGILDPVNFNKAFLALIERHEILRTTFIEVSGIPKQRIHGYDAFDFQSDYCDLRQEENKEAVLAELIKAASNKPFDLQYGPLLRATLFQWQEDEFIFSFTIHHIISDAWSFNILVKEMLLFYKSYTTGSTHSLMPLSIQYKDYALWQNRQLEGDRLTAHRNYWLSHLSGELPVLNLSTDFLRPAIMSYEGDMIASALGKELSIGLKSLAVTQGNSLYMTLVSTVLALLYKYTGNEDIIVGSPVAGREHVDLENQVGMYINNLALRTIFSGSETFEKLMNTVKENVIKSFEHQIYPYDKLIEDLNMPRDRSRSPLYDIVVVFNHISLDEVDGLDKIEGVKIEKRANGLKTSKTDLRIIFNEVGGDLTIALEYNTALYTSSRIHDMLGHYKELVSNVLVNNKKTLKELSCIPSAESRLLLNGFNQTQTNYPDASCLHELFEKQVKLTPDAIALDVEGKLFTYKELNASANQLARHIVNKQKGTPDHVIGLMMDRSERMIIGILGILKSGAAYLPIDPYYPIDRKLYMLKDGRVDFLLTDAAYMFDLPAYDGSLFAMDIQLPELSGSSENLSKTNESDNLAYVIYTSGSTGMPKGVMVEHKSAVNTVLDHIQSLSITADDKIIQLSSAAFDVSIAEIFMSLLSGATLVLLSKDITQHPETLVEYLRIHRVTFLAITPKYLNLLNLEDLPDLRIVMSGGESLSLNKIKELSDKFEYYNAYGPTECSVCATIHKGASSDNVVFIGKPISNTEVYILDADLNLLPIGLIGELCISGVGLARGYFNDEKLTKDKFVDHPYKKGERLYLTGDLAKRHADGKLEFVGRKDNQVKIRGYRIETGEIEYILNQHPLVEDALVLTALDSTRNNELRAYVKSKLDDKEIRTYLRTQLPEYMVPALIIQIEEFPRTANGKIDRAVLLSMGLEKKQLLRNYKAPDNAIETKLVKIWEDVLGKKGISVTDNFFEVGGHSLSAIRLISQIHKEFDAGITLKDIFDKPVLTEQSAAIEQTIKTPFLSIPIASEQLDYPLSSAQRRLWILSQFEGGNTAYNVQSIFMLEGKIDLKIIADCFDQLIERHEVLRTIFVENEQNEIRQVIVASEALQFKITYQDFRQEASEDKIKQVVQEECLKAFDLKTGPLLRVFLYQVADDKYIFSYTMHHIISDGWSNRVLINELLLLHQAYQEGIANAWVPLRIQYKDYACWQQEQIKNVSLDSVKSYWLNQFEGDLPVLEFPADKIRPAVKTYNGALIHDSIDAEISEILKVFSQERGGTLFMGLLAIVKTLIYRYTQQEDIIIGSPSAGRDHLDLENQIGFYVNTLALRTQFKGTDSFEELFHEIKRVTMGAYAHMTYPFDELIDNLSLPHDTSRSALFDVMVVLQNKEKRLSGLDDQAHALKVSSYNGGERVSSLFDLRFDFKEHENGIDYSIEYNTDIYNQARIEQVARHLKELLKSAMSYFKVPISQLDFLTREERNKLIIDFNTTTAAYQESKTLVDLFEEQVKKEPNRIALIHKEKEISFGSLNERANRIANFLIELQLPIESRVGILLDRGDQMLIAIMATLKAGCAYVPLDNDYPEERLLYMIEDAGITVLLTEEKLADHSFRLQWKSLALEHIVCMDHPIMDKVKEGLAHAMLNKELSNEAMISERDHSKLLELHRKNKKQYDTSILDNYSMHSPQLRISSNHLAYVLYTSGSSGQPKGCLLEHKGIVNRLAWMWEAYGFTSQDIILQKTTFTFDVSVWELLMPVCWGAKMVICTKEDISDPERIVSLIEKHKITSLHFVPSMLNAFISTAFQNKDMDYKKSLKSLRHVIVSGEELKLHTVQNWYNHVDIPVHNLYGPTEASIDVTHYSTTKQDSIIPIGTPISNTSIYILDGNLYPQPIGVLGEICIGGIGLARGYLNKPELTSEKFIANPFKENEKIYRTGDLGRWLPNGNVEFIGRKDDQVKVRGHRIELGEIEMILSVQEQVQGCVADVYKNKEDENEIIVFVKGTMSQKEVRAFLTANLPAFMIPSNIVCVDDFPLTNHGKIDRKKLLSGIVEDVSEAYVLPANEIEQAIKEVWVKILDKEHISVEDNFFSIGGNSLKLIRLKMLIEQSFPHVMTVADLFSYSTISSQANLVIRRKGITNNKGPEIIEVDF